MAFGFFNGINPSTASDSYYKGCSRLKFKGGKYPIRVGKVAALPFLSENRKRIPLSLSLPFTLW
jgi:hypothetical protein